MPGIVLSIAFATASLSGAAPTGQWDFDGGNLNATVGQPLQYIDGPTGATQQGTSFGTTTSLGIPDIGGTPANVMRFPANTNLTMGYNMPTPAAANGGGSLVNDWTIIMDLLFTGSSHGAWRGLMDTDGGLISADAEFFINNANQLGVGSYFGTINSNTWHRVGIVVQASADRIYFYIDGGQVGFRNATEGATAALDGRWTLAPAAVAALFNDNNGEAASGYVNSIQLRDVALGPGPMLALGAPSATGIPQTIPPIPSFIESRTPAVSAVGVSPQPDIQVLLNSGDTVVTQNSIKLYLQGIEVPAIVAPSGATSFAISYSTTNVLAPRSVQSLSLVHQDSVLGLQTNSWSFTVVDYQTITLPSPIVLENFDGVPEGTLPAGWSVTNQTDSLVAGFDLNDAQSDAYLDWVVISSNTLATVHGGRRLNIVPVVVNGQVLKSLVNGNLAYAESDVRGGNQVQVLFSPDYNLTGKSNIFLSFHSIYEQNQDNLGGVEFSIDQGVTWLPIIYMLDGPDIIKDAGGIVDAVATMNTARGDQAYGASYGTYIGAAISQALAPFISERINDDPVESKRVELFRLTQADNQAKVRLRFVQAGTASWYFGIDDVGLYSIDQPLPPTITKQPLSQIASAGADVTLSVVASSTSPISYQWKLNGTNVTGATSADLTLVSVQPTNAGDYTVEVSNLGGPVLSAVATLQVFSGSITQDLVVHLMFDNNLNDSSGRGNNGTAVGAPTFAPGKIGTNAVHIPSGADYVSLGAPADLNFGTDTDFSISFWAQVIAYSGDPSFIANKDWDSGGNQGYVLATDDDAHFQWNLAGPPGTRKDYDGPPGAFGNTNWHHVVVTFDRQGNAATYIDGALVDARSLTVNQNNLDTPSGFGTNIGQDGAGDYGPAFTDANIDDLGVWRRVVTPQEVASIYSEGLNGNDLTKASGAPVVLPPTITGQPFSQTVSQGGSVSFTVTATGTGTLSYQWKHNGGDVTNGTTATLTVANVQAGDAGDYSVVVGNAGGPVTSQLASLTVFNGPVSQDLVVHLTFDGTAVDSSGRGNNGTAVGTVSYVAGKVGPQALSYSSAAAGTSFNYVSLGSPTDLNFGTSTDYSVSFWSKFSVWTGDPAFIANKDWDSGGNQGWVIATAGDGRLQWNLAGPTGGRKDYDGPGGTLSGGNWHHVVVTFDRNGSALSYIDGVLVNATPLAASQNNTDTPAGLGTNIGQDGAGDYTDGNSVGIQDGTIDDVGIWRRVLTPQEAAAIYTAGQAGKDLSQAVVGAANLGTVTVSVTGSGTTITFGWTGGAAIKLQSTASLSTQNWQDVPGTAGSSTITVPIGSGNAYYRLIQ